VLLRGVAEFKLRRSALVPPIFPLASLECGAMMLTLLLGWLSPLETTVRMIQRGFCGELLATAMET